LDDLTAIEADILLFGTVYQLRHLAIRIRTQSDSARQEQNELDLLADDLENALAQYADSARGSLAVRGTRFEWGKRTYVMGIVNATPDSFSGDGVMASDSQGYVDAAVRYAEQQVAAGADIVDIGGESTRPGSQPISAEEEYRRVIPVIAALRKKVQAPISVDTYKAEIARAALDAGADMVNDVWGLRMDPEMKQLVAERRVPVVIMHNRSQPKDAVQSERLGGRYVGVEYKDLLGDVIEELRAQIELGRDAGIAPDKIIVDPGIGFGKTLEQNLELLNRVDELRVLGHPILLGPSRKGFIGYTLDLPPDQRVEGTAAAVAVGITRGVDIVRVHDVQAMARVAKMTDAIVREKG
jgi:dihydropteroate synthase